MVLCIGAHARVSRIVTLTVNGTFEPRPSFVPRGVLDMNATLARLRGGPTRSPRRSSVARSLVAGALRDALLERTAEITVGTHRAVRTARADTEST